MRLRISTQWARAGIISLLLGLLTGLWLAPPGLWAESNNLYFAATNQSLNNTYGFLDYWRTNNGAELLGVPITAPLTENGLTVQYFERGRLELHSELEGSPILLGRLGAEYAAALWLNFAPAPDRPPTAGVEFFAITGHSLGDPFLRFWNEHGGLNTFGYPISEPVWEYVGDQMVQVQYFERGRLEHHPLAAGTPDEIRISALGRSIALMRGIDLGPLNVPALQPSPVPPTPTPRPAAPRPSTEAAARPAAANPAPPRASTSGSKSIIVDLGDQWLYAYEGNTQVFDAPVSTGKDGFNTPPGTFSIYAKLVSQTMSGTLGGEYYNVPNVPHVMYINGGVALHGTYWHNQFGTGVRRSHGCINLPLKSAAWLYAWAPVGTPVTVRW